MCPHNLANFSKKEFIKLFKDLYEHSPWVVEESYEDVKNDSTYEEIEPFHKLLSNIMLNASKKLQDKLIKAHPMLAGKEAKKGELTDFSNSEQKSAGLDSCTPKEIKLFNTLNNQYFEKFGFPYILAVKGRNKKEIVENFQSRLNNSYDVEREEALKQINQIALIRIKDIYGR
jgi:OHCU decarboxylase